MLALRNFSLLGGYLFSLKLVVRDAVVWIERRWLSRAVVVANQDLGRSKTPRGRKEGTEAQTIAVATSAMDQFAEATALSGLEFG